MKVEVPRDKRVADLVAGQTKQGGIIPTKLNYDTTVLVETNKFIYQITPLATEIGMKFVVDSGSPVTRGRKICYAIDSHYQPLKYEMIDWIGRGLRMILRFDDSVTILTAEIHGATITNTKGWSYDVWR